MPQQYIQTLISNDVALIHCSSESVLVGNHYTTSLGVLEKLQKAIFGSPVISASTVGAGDQMVCPTKNYILNYTGPVGVIISPRLANSITHANPQDSGSTPQIRDLTRANNTVCSVAQLQASISNRVNYNEIFIHTYKTIGVFISRPVQFNISGQYVTIDDSEIFSAFPNQEFYQLHNGEFYKLVYDKSKKSFVPGRKYLVSEIYA